jgi:hypothetical protein
LFEQATLVEPTAQNKRELERWLSDCTTTGAANPLDGLKIAFRSGPELIYWIDDGDHANNDEILATLRRWNAGGHTRINTVAFLPWRDDEMLDDHFFLFMKAVARENGGTFEIMYEEDF